MDVVILKHANAQGVQLFVFAYKCAYYETLNMKCTPLKQNIIHTVSQRLFYLARSQGPVGVHGNSRLRNCRDILYFMAPVNNTFPLCEHLFIFSIYSQSTAPSIRDVAITLTAQACKCLHIHDRYHTSQGRQTQWQIYVGNHKSCLSEINT